MQTKLRDSKQKRWRKKILRKFEDTFTLAKQVAQMIIEKE